MDQDNEALAAPDGGPGTRGLEDAQPATLGLGVESSHGLAQGQCLVGFRVEWSPPLQQFFMVLMSRIGERANKPLVNPLSSVGH